MEFVYVVRRLDLFPLAAPHGLVLLDAAGRDALTARIRAKGFFVERRHAETDASLKQVIPYCVVRRGDHVFLTRRTSGGGDSRLFGKRSIGIGGHVNPVDGDDVLGGALRREVDEELAIGGPWTVRAAGILNDDSTDVGSVHVGLVHVIDTAADVAVRETDRLTGGFVPRGELERLCGAERPTFETWSALLVDRLGELIG